MDDQASLGELKARIREFCEERDWDQYHGPKDLGVGIVTEAAELLDHFRFLSEEQALEKLEDPSRRVEIEQELADVFFFVLRFAQRFEIDLDDSLARKLELNAERYPVDKARGKNLKYNDL